MTYPERFPLHTMQVGGVDIAYRAAGAGPPLLLLHGFPQTNYMWHKVAPKLARRFTVVAADLRGYGDSGKPPSDDEHAAYSKRAMAADMAALMGRLGHSRFFVAGHDRGGRVAHRMARDYPHAVRRVAVIDIAPTASMYRQTDMRFATAYYHWFFLIQPAPLPERLIAADAKFYLRAKSGAWSGASNPFTDDAFADYLRCFRRPETIHAMCEDYRAAATIDLQHDAADADAKLTMPLLALWGAKGFVGGAYDVVAEWQAVAENVRGHAVPGGHYCAEESPEETTTALMEFFDGE